MQGRTLILGSGVIVYLLSWLVPVLADGTALGAGGLPGWEAFRYALAPLWPYKGLTGEGGFSDVLAVASASTNVWFVVSVTLVALRRRERLAYWGLALAWVVDAVWFVSSDRGSLRIGYWLWLAAFVLVAMAAKAGSRRTPTA